MKPKYNEYDDSYIETYRKKRKRARIKKRKRVTLFVVSILLITLFLFSGMSRVNSVQVEGNQFVSEASILSASKVNDRSFYFLIWPNQVERRIESLPSIKHVEVSNHLFKGITIKVEETVPVGYGANAFGSFYLDGKGHVVVYDDLELNSKMTDIPLLVGFNEEKKLQVMSKELANIEASVYSQISEIKETGDVFDSDQIVFVMSDRKLVYVNVYTMAEKLNYYNEVVAQYPNHCIFHFDYDGNAIVKEC